MSRANVDKNTSATVEKIASAKVSKGTGDKAGKGAGNKVGRDASNNVGKCASAKSGNVTSEKSEKIGDSRKKSKAQGQDSRSLYSSKLQARAGESTSYSSPELQDRAGEGNSFSSAELQARADAIGSRLRELYPDAECALEYSGEPWRLLVMGRLSAQCTDKRVNEVCRELFAVFPTPEALAYADIEEIRRIIRPCGLFNVKADDIKEECRALVEDFGGRLPDTMDELLSLRGVGRKIANLLLGDIFKKGGIVADTHCIRICGRLGFYPEEQKDPLKTEKIMSRFIPLSEQSDFCHRIVLFGREYCKAQSPDCVGCKISDICRSKSKKL